MKRSIGWLTVLLAALAACGCGAASDKKDAAVPASSADASAEGEVCPAVSPGPPPVCPEGCKWNGTECRGRRPIVIYDRPPAQPAPTVSQPISQPAPSTP